jgi:pimeloyl-ACP methyl ester carboxylesterase
MHQMGFRGSFSGNWREFADCRVRLYSLRSGERESFSAVFVHGRYGESSHWEPVLSRLEGAARCICVDLPGFGDSYAYFGSGVSLIRAAALLEEIVEELTSETPVVLIGHDIGGTVALMSAIRLASRLEGLVLIGPACLTCPPAGLTPGFLARRRLRGSVAAKNLKFAALRAISESWPRHYERLAWKRAFASVELPALLLWGSQDAISPVAFGAELLRQLPNAELLEHPLASHWLPAEDPSWVAIRIREFLYRIGRGVSVQKSL